MFNEKYKQLNEQIEPSQILVNKVKNFSNTKTMKLNNKVKNIILKPAIAIMTLVITFCSMPVLAANVPVIYDLMYLVSPSVAQYFMPVQKKYEDQGIRMEVVSAQISENEAQIYITMQDLTGDRIDETIDLNDSYCIKKAFDCTTNTCRMVGFEKETKTATFMITITNINNKKIDGKKITFLVKNFMSHKQEWKDIKLPISFEGIDNNTETMQVRLTGFSATEENIINDYKNNKISNTVIVPKSNIDFGVTDMQLTGVKYIDNKIHIQVSAKNNTKIDNHGEIYLKNNLNNEIKKCEYKMGFALGQNGDKIEYSPKYLEGSNENRLDFTEYVFDISKEELENYSVYGDFVVSGISTDGNWKVTFSLENSVR